MLDLEKEMKQNGCWLRLGSRIGKFEKMIGARMTQTMNKKSKLKKKVDVFGKNVRVKFEDD
jgi:hypothetical protein